MIFPTIQELTRDLTVARVQASFEGEGVYVLLEINEHDYVLHIDPPVTCKRRDALWTSEIVCPEDDQLKLTELARHMIQICEADYDMLRDERDLE